MILVQDIPRFEGTVTVLPALCVYGSELHHSSITRAGTTVLRTYLMASDQLLPEKDSPLAVQKPPHSLSEFILLWEQIHQAL